MLEAERRLKKIVKSLIHTCRNNLTPPKHIEVSNNKINVILLTMMKLPSYLYFTLYSSSLVSRTLL